MNKSIERAYQIISHHIENIDRLHGLVKSVVLVGSLSDDTYTGNEGSDIDLIHVLHDAAPMDSREIVRACIAKTELETDKDIPISKCIYFYRDLLRPYKKDFELNENNRDMVELPIEIMRMKDSGKAVYGEDIIRNIDTPTWDDVLTFHDISERWSKSIAEQDPESYRTYMETAANPPIRLIVQSVLTRAMIHYYFYTGNSCSSKALIYDKMRTAVADYRFLRLLELSHKWRFDPDSIMSDERDFLMSEYQVWYQILKDKPYDYVPIERCENGLDLY